MSKQPSPATLQFRRELKAAYAETLAEERASEPRLFLVQVYDACSSEEIGLHTFQSAEQAATALGITWQPGYTGSKITHRANVPRGDYFAYTEPEDYDADDIARYNEYEDVYASGVYAKPGERIKWND